VKQRLAPHTVGQAALPAQLRAADHARRSGTTAPEQVL